MRSMMGFLPLYKREKWTYLFNQLRHFYPDWPLNFAWTGPTKPTKMKHKINVSMARTNETNKNETKNQGLNGQDQRNQQK